PALGGEGGSGVRRLDDFSRLVEAVRRIRTDLGLPWEGYDVVVEADSHGQFAMLEPADQGAWAEAGATWWVESWWDVPEGSEGLAEVRRRVEAGPPVA
ncbi:MAG TPA: LLM class flavin-dependent oxidoreductase, partial [Intrasporangium sp.]|nr:LLM class flavin-dependent oxidoreductase [Intrasporangium sp.]